LPPTGEAEADCGNRSPSGALDFVTQLLELGDHPVALVALNLDFPILDRPARAAFLLERGGEPAKAGLIQRDVEHRCHAFATTSGGLAPDFRCSGLTGHSFEGRRLRCSALLRPIASAENACDQVHDLALNEVEHFRIIVDVPVFDLVDPRWIA